VIKLFKLRIFCPPAGNADQIRQFFGFK
jgi:hypothetical protein